MRFLIITGLSGAGKSSVASSLEDMGYYCVDNMPAVMMPKFAELCLATKGKYERVALVTDVRGGENFDVLFTSLEKMSDMGCDYRIVFVEANDDVVVRRYKETRRVHPISGEMTLKESVKKERQMLSVLRDRAHYIIDTSSFSSRELRVETAKLFSDKNEQVLFVKVRSFGYKYGIPSDADLVFDVRFLPNPYYVDDLKNKTGLDEQVSNFVFSYKQTNTFMSLIQDLLTFLLPQYFAEGKGSLVIAVGCTGGQHRSVAVAEKIGEFIKMKGYPVNVGHINLPKG